MIIMRFQRLLVAVGTWTLVMGARAATPPSATSDAQQIRDVALAVLDASRPFDAAALGSVVLQSEMERQFATEMLKAMRAEVSMGRRAAAAVGGSKESEEARRMDRAAAATGDAVTSAEPAISGDTATMPFAPGGGRATTLAFHKVDGRWRFDLLRRYRERGQINEAGIARWKARQKAAESVAEIYEQKQERDLSVLPLVYETMCKQLAEEAVKALESSRTTQAK